MFSIQFDRVVSHLHVQNAESPPKTKNKQIMQTIRAKSVSDPVVLTFDVCQMNLRKCGAMTVVDDDNSDCGNPERNIVEIKNFHFYEIPIDRTVACLCFEFSKIGRYMFECII